MKIKTFFTRILKAAIITAGIMLLSSCPQQVTAPMVALVEDELSPAIRVTAPSSGDNYYSDVTVSGFITDDVLEEGDSSGQITSIYYEITNDDYRKAKIDIGLDDQITADTSFGDGSIEYDISTGEFSFTFSTIEPNTLRDLLSMTITAVDRNNNRTSEKLNLSESGGPYVEFYFYSSSDYADASKISSLSGDRVYLGGTMGNSEYKTDSADEIVSINWTVAGTSLGSTLDISSDSDDWDASAGVFRTTNAFEESEYFNYNPVTNFFYTETYIDVLEGSKNFLVTATDAYGHETTAEELLTPPASLMLSTPVTSKTHFSKNPDFADARTINISSRLTDPNDGVLTSDQIEYVRCSFASTVFGETIDYTYDYYTAGVDDFNDKFNMTTDPGSFNFDISTENWPGTAASASDGGKLISLTGDVSVKVTVKELDKSGTKTKSVVIEQDNDSPSITVNSFTGGTSEYVAAGDYLELDFTVSDGDSGVDDVSSIEINGDTIASADIDKSGNNYSTTYEFPSQAMSSDSGDDFGYTITLYDNAGNIGIGDNEDLAAKTYYGEYTDNICVIEDAGDDDGIFEFGSSNSVDGWVRSTTTANDTITLTFTSNRVLSGAPTVTIAGKTASVNTSSAPVYTATYNAGNGEALSDGGTLSEGDVIPFIVSLTDITGNPGSFTYLDGSTYENGFSNLYYDNVLPGQPAAPVFSSAQAAPYDTDTYINSAEEGSVSMSINYGANTGNGDTIQLFLEGTPDTLLGSDTSNGGASSTIADSGNIIPGLSDGLKYFHARVIDVAGNIGPESTALELTLDTAAPTATITGNSAYGYPLVDGVDLSSSTSGDTGTYYWSVSGTGTSPDTSGAVFVPAPYTTDQATFSLDSCSIDGQYTAELYVKDHAGNQSATDSFDFIWDAGDFSIASISGLSNSSFHDSEISNVEAVLSGNESGTTYIQWSSTDGTFNFSPEDSLITDITSLSDDIEDVTVTIRDAFSRERSYTVTNVTWDTLDPTIDAITDNQGYRNLPFTITASASDGSGISNYQWTVEKDGSAFDVVNQSGVNAENFAVNEGVNTLSLATNGDDDGYYEVSLVVTDGAGNTSAAEEFYFTWDYEQFEINVTGLSSNSYHNSAINGVEAVLTGNESGTSSIAWTASNSTDFSFSDFGSLTTNITSSSSSASTSVTITVIDNLGRTSTQTLTSIVYDSLAPTIDDIGPQGDKRTTFSVNPADYNVDGTGSGIASYNWLVTSGGFSETITEAIFSVNNGAGSLSLETNGNDDGDYNVALTITDQAENTNATAETFSFTWDTEGPSITAIDPQGPFNTAFTVTPDYIDDVSGVASAVWSATKDGSGITLANSSTTNFCVNENENTLLLTTTADDDSDDGAYEVTLTVTDNAGNPSTENFTFEWDNKQFTGSISGITEGEVTGSDSFALIADITGCESGVKTYAWSITSEPSGANPGFNDNSTGTTTFSTNKDGAYTIQLIVTDELNRNDTFTVSFTVDTTDPVVNDILISGGGADPYLFAADITEPNMGSYSWSISANDASSPALTGPDTANPTLENFTSGVEYTIGLIVTDAAGNTMATAYTETFTPSVTRSLSFTTPTLKTCNGGSGSDKPSSPQSSYTPRISSRSYSSSPAAASPASATVKNESSAVTAARPRQVNYSGDLYKNTEPETNVNEISSPERTMQIDSDDGVSAGTGAEVENVDAVTELEDEPAASDSMPVMVNPANAASAATARSIAASENISVSKQNKKSAVIPIAAFVILTGVGAGIFIRKRRKL